MNRLQRWANTEVIGMIVITAIFLLVAGLLFLSNTRDFGATMPATIFSPTIPESTTEAKAYIDQASEAADAKDYETALRILDEAIAAFPNDKNLQLTREFYSIEASRYAQ